MKQKCQNLKQKSQVDEKSKTDETLGTLTIINVLEDSRGHKIIVYTVIIKSLTRGTRIIECTSNTTYIEYARIYYNNYILVATQNYVCLILSLMA